MAVEVGIHSEKLPKTEESVGLHPPLAKLFGSF
jgi:hypothetical protein